MKICPQCQTTYTDDSLQYCLQDGENLFAAKEVETETPTVVLEKPERYTTNKNLDKMRIDVQQPQADDFHKDFQSAAQPTVKPKSSNTLIIILATVLGMLLLLAGAVGAWLYLAENEPETVQNTNVEKENADDKIIVPSPTAAKDAEPKKTPTAKPTASAEPTKTPAPDFDARQIERDVSARVNSWKNAAESLNLDSYMNNYAQTVDFYNKKNADIGFVKRDKQRAFSVYDTIKMNFGYIRVIPDSSGEKATAVFDKQWNFSGKEKSSEGKVQTQLTLAKIGGEWKITGEKDLKVYYVK